MRVWRVPMTQHRGLTRAPSRNEPLSSVVLPKVRLKICRKVLPLPFTSSAPKFRFRGVNRFRERLRSIPPADQIDHTLELFRAAFDEQRVAAAWERVIGMVVRPGVRSWRKRDFRL